MRPVVIAQMIGGQENRITCSACNGKGSVTCRGAKEQCLNCEGSGYKVDVNLPCSVCGGKGVICKGG